MGLGSLIKMFPAISAMGKISKISGDEYASRFKHPALRKVIGYMPPDSSATTLLFTLATLAVGDGGYPEGGTALTVPFMNDTYDFWKRAKDEGWYEAEKQSLAEQICRAVCTKYPQAEGKIEVIDIATPLTYEHYTGAYHGSWMGIMSKGDKQTQYPGYLDSIKGVYFAGHRMTSPGGMPVALLSGRNAAQMVCKQFDTVLLAASNYQ